VNIIELAEQLTRAAYVADGGELPAMETHYRVWRHRYARITAAILRKLAEHPTYEPVRHDLRFLVDEAELP
jgi:hypothetical protein